MRVLTKACLIQGYNVYELEFESYQKPHELSDINQTICNAGTREPHNFKIRISQPRS